MRNIVIYIRSLVALACLAGCGDRTVVDDPQSDAETKETKVVAGWVMSEDGTLGTRLRTQMDPVMRDSRFVLVVELRNFSNKPFSVLKPLNGPFVGMPIGLEVRGPKGNVIYIGPKIQSRTHEREDFVKLESGQTLEDAFAIDDPDFFSGADIPGEYVADFRYFTQNLPAVASGLRIDDLWTGHIKVSAKVRRVAENRFWATSASGNDGRISVTISAYEQTMAPGEVARIHGTCKVLTDRPVGLPCPGSA